MFGFVPRNAVLILYEKGQDLSTENFPLTLSLILCSRMARKYRQKEKALTLCAKGQIYAGFCFAF